MEAAHGRDALLGALDRAIAFGRWHAADVRSILSAGAGLPQPRDPGADLDLDLPAAAIRPLTAYSLDALRAAEVAR